MRFMLHFQEHPWELDTARSRFSAYIADGVRSSEGVCWILDLQYVPGGAAWRDVDPCDRPSFSLQVSGFDPVGGCWTGLEQLNFWNWDEDEEEMEKEEEDLNAACLAPLVFYRPDCESELLADSSVDDFMWRVIARDGPRFTVEMSGCAHLNEMSQGAFDLEAAIQRPGSPDRREGEAPHCRAQGDFYLLETVPFGTVTVLVPRNAPDPRSYAVIRARQLTGSDEPDQIEIKDLADGGDDFPVEIGNELHVELHFHGVFRD
jgi:hypothetical protein